MATKRWAGLLRAVNVGGRTLPMATLREVAEEAGFEQVRTLLASGNVVFTGSGSAAAVRGRLERAIAEHAGFRVEVLLRSKQQLDRLLADNPFRQGKGSQVLVGFLDGPAPAGLAAALVDVAVNEEVVVAGKHVWVHFPDGMGRSALAARLPTLARPRIVTGRNVNTVTRLAGMLDPD